MGCRLQLGYISAGWWCLCCLSNIKSSDPCPEKVTELAMLLMDGDVPVLTCCLKWTSAAFPVMQLFPKIAAPCLSASSQVVDVP